jgi:hypothetical protein
MSAVRAADPGVAGRYALTTFMSAVFHALVALGIFIFGHCGVPQGGGQGGHFGLDGATLDFEVAGPLASSQGAPQRTEPFLDEGPDEVMTADPTPTSNNGFEVRERPRRRRNRPQPEPETPPAPTMEQAGGGTGSEVTDPGQAAGLASEILRGGIGIGANGTGDLPAVIAAARCPDPAAGTWRAMKYDPDQHHWVTFTLKVRQSGSALTGTITSRTWSGGPSDRRPPECRPFGSDVTVRMPASGYFSNGEMVFESSTWRIIREDCPSRPFHYAPDRFRGTVDQAGERFDSLNNDGAYDIDEPYMFRRVSCE